MKKNYVINVNIHINIIKSTCVLLDWTHLESNVGLILLKWIYTGKVLQENLTLDLMKAASNFQLLDLVDQCERYLIGIVGLKDCVQLYAAAEELGAQRLKEHCSSLISAHWVRKVEINIKLYKFNFLLNANYIFTKISCC